MLIVMSDLHLAESVTYQLGQLKFNHNLPAEVYRAYFREIAGMTQEDNIATIDLVLAGDIFELTRSAFWLQDNLRPYIHNSDVLPGSLQENRILEIVSAIESDSRVAETLDIIRGLQNIFQQKVRIHYIPGNHDRLLNATPLVRQKIQGLLGLPINNAPFMNQYLQFVEGEARVLIRHGHEYDPANFSENLETWATIPTFIDTESYQKAVVGDIVTVEIASRLPKNFREYYSENRILSDQHLLMVYRRLIDFDNVRPAHALMNFLFSTPGLSQREVWELIEPVFLTALNQISADELLPHRITELGKFSGLTAILIHALQRNHIWKNGIPFWLIERILNSLSGKIRLGSSLHIIKREQCYQPGASRIQCMVTGHTHNPLVELVRMDEGKEKYYINCGTFRNLITSTPELDNFGRLRSKARVLIFEKGERNPEYSRATGWSFDFTSKYGFGAEPEIG